MDKNNLFIMLFMVIFLQSVKGLGQSQTVPIDPDHSKIIAIWGKLMYLDSAFQESHTSSLRDSIYLTNEELAKVLSDSSAGRLGSSDLINTAKSIGIDVHTSNDKRLTILSWKLQNPSPTPPYCNNILIGSNENPLIISLYGGGENDFGSNVQIDKILNFDYKAKRFYLFLGENSCGVFCVTKNASIYKLNGHSFEMCKDAFVHGGNKLDQIDFEYSLELKRELSFHYSLKDYYIIVPRMSEDYSSQSGNTKFDISPK